MESVIPMGIALFIYAMVQMMRLSLQIEHLRSGKTAAPSSIWAELAKGVSNHALPGPFFAAFHDDEAIKKLIKKRNSWVALFWIAVLVGMILSLTIKSTTPPVEVEHLK